MSAYSMDSAIPSPKLSNAASQAEYPNQNGHIPHSVTPKKEHQSEEKLTENNFGVSLIMRQDSVEYVASNGTLHRNDKEGSERTPYGEVNAKKGYEAVVCEDDTEIPVKKNIVSASD